MASDYFNDVVASMRSQYGSGRTDLSRRREQAQIDQRTRNGDLRPGQRSLNDGS